MSPLFLFSLVSFLFLASFIETAEKIEEIKSLKRLRDANLEQLVSTSTSTSTSTFAPILKQHQFVFLQSRNLSNSFGLFRSFDISRSFDLFHCFDLFRSISDQFYFENLPHKIKEFSRIFKISWNAHENDFLRTGDFNFELMNWGTNPLITNLSFVTHFEFIKQILKKGSSFKTVNCWELLREYINFTFTHYKHERPSTESFIEMLILSVKALEPKTFKTILKYRPEYLSDESSNNLWFVLIQTALERNLVVSEFSKDATNWIELFYFSSINFGPCYNLNNHQTSKDDNNVTLRLNYLVKLQPLVSAMARHDSNLFMSFFFHDNILKFITENGKNSVYFWFNRFLNLDESVKRFNPENEQKFSALADKLYVCLCTAIPFTQLLEDCINCNRHFLPQFILMYSADARNYVSSMPRKYKLLQNLVQVLEFDFDFMNMVTIITGFDLKWSDLEEHLLPSLEIRFRDTPLIRGLKFILQVAESFPINFDPSIPWTIPSISSSLTVDSEYPFLLDAARIILSRHFKILPIFTLSNEIGTEEACFRDLCWFMTFFINLCRPDLGSNYKIFLKY